MLMSNLIGIYATLNNVIFKVNVICLAMYLFFNQKFIMGGNFSLQMIFTRLNNNNSVNNTVIKWIMVSGKVWI